MSTIHGDRSRSRSGRAVAATDPRRNCGTMGLRSASSSILLICCWWWSASLLLSSSVEGYKNYTVGGDLGWVDDQAKPEIDYQKWADNNSYSLGDFLISVNIAVFNTDNNHSVVQTYNSTTYELCNVDADDVTQWSTADPSSTAVQPMTLPVPLLKEGATYFFSGDYDGDQCRHGQRFHINVTHGQGLPPSLKDMVEDSAPGPANPTYGYDDDSTPDPVVQTDFNHPDKNPDTGSDGGGDGEVAAKASSDSPSVFVGGRLLLVGLLGGVLVFCSSS